MKKIIIILLLLLLPSLGHSENYLLNGGQESRIQYKMEQKVEPNPAIKTLYLSFVIPVSYQSPTYNQKIVEVNLDYSPRPDNREEFVDCRGNKVVKVSWNRPSSTISTIVSLLADNKTILQQLETNALFPPVNIPTDVTPYLNATEQVPVNHPVIVAKAREITAGAKTEFDAVQRILTWVIDHTSYVLTPPEYGALFTFNSGKGNCQNYSHLAAALMRAVGIPVRIVNGITLNRPYSINMGNRSMTLKMAEGRHSWIEVYFPDLGWAPFDPQQTQLFVSNRFIRVEVGMDNEETSQDGLIRWTQARGDLVAPRFEESIEASFTRDNVQIMAKKESYGPKKLLLTPAVETSFKPIAIIKEPEPIPTITPDQMDRLIYSTPYMFGNLEFPKNVDFLSARGPSQRTSGNNFEMRKNFLVETAEYVTEQAQYAQVFVLDRPMDVRKIGLALHKFGGSGFLWLELLKERDGFPDATIATSDMVSVDGMKYTPGYDWFDFDFSNEAPKLSPGHYWIALGFSGKPILNWFYSYGKPVGPVDGTRFKTILDTEWSNSLNFEFNYRVIGFIAQ
jgi:transglutaminase-like putative cysteine protease